MEELRRCSTCGDPITIGFLMPDGDYVCADYACCYEYCKATGKRVEIEENAQNIGKKECCEQDGRCTFDE